MKLASMCHDTMMWISKVANLSIVLNVNLKWNMMVGNVMLKLRNLVNGGFVKNAIRCIKIQSDKMKEFEMIGKINPNIFGGLTKGTLKTCPKCGKLMEWNNNQWECFCK